MLSDRAQEILETLWLQHEGEAPVPLSALEKTKAFNELSQLGYVSVSDGQVQLTERGLREAAGAIRRHRLSERLMADVLDMGETGLDEASCQVEHLLYRGLEDRVCRLLGHPRVCPHGKPIPPGPCCKEGAPSEERLIAPLADMETGEEGRVAYLHTGDGTRMRELMAIGLVPGVSVKLMHKSPTYVLALGECEFAVDEGMARAVYVRLK
ncbi:MAG TPA: metal-dependent transcriptional regulator [Armatimonadota bacterium]|jgi:DtxR family Mn-dependent transcriptional regulator